MRALFIFLLFTGVACADDFKTYVNFGGVSYHRGSCGGEQCNEDNYGLGVQHTRTGKWPLHLSAGVFENSFGESTWYAGVARTRRFGGARYGIEVGAVVSVMHYVWPDRSKLVMAPLPMLALDMPYGRVTLVHVPKVSSDTDETLFIQTAVLWDF